MVILATNNPSILRIALGPKHGLV